MAARRFEDLLNDRLRESDRPRPHASFDRPRTGTAAAYGFFFIDDDAPVSGRPLKRRDVPAGRHDPRAQPLVGPHASPEPDHRVTPRQRGAADGRCATYPPEHETPAAEPPSRQPRHLSRRQREAVAILEALGASLPSDFTTDELRAVFRSLARRYHPDRHPRCSEDERVRLGVLFGHAHDAYRALSRA